MRKGWRYLKKNHVEAKVIKKPSKKTKTVEVELMHEELIIENKAVQDKTSTTTPVTAAAISKGRTKPEDIISYTTGISAETGTVLNPKTEATITKIWIEI